MGRGWGTFFGAIGDLIPGRKERLRNKIEKIERELDELGKQNYTDARAWRYDRLSHKLRQAREKLRNL